MGVLIYGVTILTDSNMIVYFFSGSSKRQLASTGALPLCLVVTRGIPVILQVEFNSLLRSGLRIGRRQGDTVCGGRGLWQAAGPPLGLARAGKVGWGSQPTGSGGLKGHPTNGGSRQRGGCPKST